MTIEVATYISSLNATYPAASDPKSEGDDHIRLLKSTVKATFPNVSGAVTPTHTELNYVAGVTSAIQTQLTAKASITGTETLTNKTINLTSNTLTGTTAQFNTALSDGDFATLAGTETLTNKSLTSPTITGTGTAQFGSLTNTGSTTLGGETTITSASTGNTLKITNTGSGNSLLVEDSASTDSTPFVINSVGTVGIGTTNPAAVGVGVSAGLALESATAFAPTVAISNTTTDTNSSSLLFYKQRSGLIVSSGDQVALVRGYGYDGANPIPAAQIRIDIDGTPGANDMPGRLVFSTTADGASTPTERMRISSAGAVGIGAASGVDTTLYVAKNITGATVAYGITQAGTVQSDVTSSAYSFLSAPSTTATAFTLSDLRHYQAQQGTIGAGSSITSQYGFAANASLTGATNNYGFYGNIASGTGRYNFYAAGTADNYFAGSVGIGTSFLTGINLHLGKSITGATSAFGTYTDSSVASDVTTIARGYSTYLTTQAAAFTLLNLHHYEASQNTFGAGSTVTSQFGFTAASTLTGATNNYGFFGNIASGTGRYNFFANGTAANAFSGDVKIFGAGGLGYDTGSGGTVTQATSRTTGVTLNKTNGAITLFTAAGSATATTFTVTNSTVAATDVIQLSVKSGTNVYLAFVTAVAAGSFNVTFQTTGGTASDAPVINFAVIKAVTA